MGVFLNRKMKFGSGFLSRTSSAMRESLASRIEISSIRGATEDAEDAEGAEGAEAGREEKTNEF